MKKTEKSLVQLQRLRGLILICDVFSISSCFLEPCWQNIPAQPSAAFLFRLHVKQKCVSVTCWHATATVYSNSTLAVHRALALNFPAIGLPTSALAHLSLKNTTANRQRDQLSSSLNEFWCPDKNIKVLTCQAVKEGETLGRVESTWTVEVVGRKLIVKEGKNTIKIEDCLYETSQNQIYLFIFNNKYK